MARQPTQEQVKEFWFKFGLRCDNVGWYVPINEVDAVPDYYIGGLSTPDLDLNNLFKYAVPKLEPLGYNLLINNDLEMLGWSVCCSNTKSECSIASPMVHCELGEIALALFWVLWQVREVNNSKEEKH